MTPTTHGEGLTQKAFENKASRILVLLEIKATLRISGCVGHLGWRMFPEAVTWKIIHHRGQKEKKKGELFSADLENENIWFCVYGPVTWILTNRMMEHMGNLCSGFSQ